MCRSAPPNPKSSQSYNMHERPLPDLEFSDPDKIAKFLGEGWERSPESRLYYQFTRIEEEKTHRELELSFPTYPGGLFTATVPDGPKFFVMGVIDIRLIPAVSNFPQAIVVGSDRAQFSLETEGLIADFRPVGDGASHVFVNFRDELRRPSVG